MIGGSGSGETNLLHNLINLDPDTDKIVLCNKDPHGVKCNFLTKKRKKCMLKVCN